MLEIKNLSVAFGKKTIFRDLNIRFNNGEITGIKGSSGTGKSTLLNIIGQIKKPNKECKYLYNDEEINVFDEKETSNFRMNNIGFIFQQGNLLNNLTALENVMIPSLMWEKNSDKVREKAKYWMNYVNLSEEIDKYPCSLSGGEEQRVAIARALINECDIILADEPTASLDEENQKKVMDTLKKLANELNKIVIVVSHDKKTLDYCDRVLEISDWGLIEIENKRPTLENNRDKKYKKKCLKAFIKSYNKMRKRESIANKVLIGVTSLIVSIATLSIGFGDFFVSSQMDFVNSISDRSLLVINDTMDIDAIADYEEALAFDQEFIDYVKEIPSVDKVYEYYEFASYGQCADKNASAQIIISDKDKNICEKEYGNTYVADGNEFSVAPIYDEEDLDSYLIKGSSKEIKEGQVYLTYDLAKELCDSPKKLIGKNIKIKCFVPGKLCKSTAENEYGETKIDLGITTLVSLEKEVAGILNQNYRNEKKDNNGQLILMGNKEMNDIIKKNILSTNNRTFEDFDEKELKPSMLVVFAQNYNETANIEKKILNKSSSAVVVNKSADIRKTGNNLKKIKNTMICISVVMIAIVTVLFAFLYFYKNRERKQEIGILKSLGLSKNDTLKLIASDVIKNTILIFVFSVIYSLIIQILVNIVFGFECISINLLEVVIAMLISIVSVMISGMVSVSKTSSIDIIEAINANRI